MARSEAHDQWFAAQLKPQDGLLPGGAWTALSRQKLSFFPYPTEVGKERNRVILVLISTVSSCARHAATPQGSLAGCREAVAIRVAATVNFASRAKSSASAVELTECGGTQCNVLMPHSCGFDKDLCGRLAGIV